MLAATAALLLPASPAFSPRALVAGLNAIPPRYLAWYQGAARTCPGLRWEVLAGIGTMESDNGRSRARGVHHGQNRKGAEGPMQFEPATFREYTVRADRSARLTPYDPKDAIFSAARMLCADGARGGTRKGVRGAIFAYNHAHWYVRDVLSIASRYTVAARALRLKACRPVRHHGHHGHRFWRGRGPGRAGGRRGRVQEGRPAVGVGQPAAASAATSAVTAASTSTRAVSACVWARSRSPRAMQSKATRASCWAAWSSRAAWSSAGLFCSVSELVILGPSPVWRALALIGLGDRHVTRSEDCSPGATHETIPGTEEDAMCRLFGLTAGTTAVRTTFWLLDAPDSLEVQSHRNADGAGIGFFDAARAPVLDKQPEPAFADQEFIREARQASSATFVAHVRWASTGGRTVQNTHPFAMHGRIMAHNGGFGELALLEKQVGPYLALVQGDTDSERYFALIIKETEAHGGDVGGGVTAAGGGVAAHLPLSSLNTIVAAPGELWAFRYPAQHALHILERPAGTFRVEAGARGLHVRSATSSVHAP